jgi:hypothetical protein
VDEKKKMRGALRRVRPEKLQSPETLRFDSINATLLNEFLKEHRKVEEQQKTIDELKGQITGLVSAVKEQAAQIEHVSNQIRSNRHAPQLVNNGL